MRRCGATANGCNGSPGKYVIDYVIPDSSYVRMRYAGEAWREFKDASQNLRFENVRESTPAQPGQCPTRYRFFVRFRIRPSAPWTNRTITMGTGQIGPIRQMTLFLNSGASSNPESPPFLTGPPPDRFVEGLARSGNFILKIWAKQFGSTTGQEIQSNLQFGNTGIFEVARAEYLGMERIDGQPDNCSPGGSTCTFRVLGANNAVIYSEKRTDCPEAVTIPENYRLNRGNFQIKNSDPTKLLRVVRSEESNRKVTSIFLGDTLMQKLLSPLGSTLYPRVCWDCDGAKKCPKGTCEVKCGTHTCCYNAQGISVYSFKP